MLNAHTRGNAPASPQLQISLAEHGCLSVDEPEGRLSEDLAAGAGSHHSADELARVAARNSASRPGSRLRCSSFSFRWTKYNPAIQVTRAFVSTDCNSTSAMVL